MQIQSRIHDATWWKRDNVLWGRLWLVTTASTRCKDVNQSCSAHKMMAKTSPSRVLKEESHVFKIQVCVASEKCRARQPAPWGLTPAHRPPPTLKRGWTPNWDIPKLQVVKSRSAFSPNPDAQTLTKVWSQNYLGNWEGSNLAIRYFFKSWDDIMYQVKGPRTGIKTTENYKIKPKILEFPMWLSRNKSDSHSRGHRFDPWPCPVG